MSRRAQAANERSGIAARHEPGWIQRRPGQAGRLEKVCRGTRPVRRLRHPRDGRRRPLVLPEVAEPAEARPRFSEGGCGFLRQPGTAAAARRVEESGHDLEAAHGYHRAGQGLSGRCEEIAFRLVENLLGCGQRLILRRHLSGSRRIPTWRISPLTSTVSASRITRGREARTTFPFPARDRSITNRCSGFCIRPVFMAPWQSRHLRVATISCGCRRSSSMSGLLRHSSF